MRAAPALAVAALAFAVALGACAWVVGFPDLPNLPDASPDASGQDTSADTSVDAAPVDAAPCPGKTQCGLGDGGPPTCADLTKDPNNCGACNRFCPSKSCINSDCVRRVFVSSVVGRGDAIGQPTIDGGPTGAKIVDARCQTLAVDAGLGGSYKAWISDDYSSPSTRFTHSKAPYIRTDGIKIANDWASLTSGALLNAINHDEKDAAVTSGPIQVWTGTEVDGGGTILSNCNNWWMSGGSGWFGILTVNDGHWTHDNFSVDCTFIYHFYCFEQ